MKKVIIIGGGIAGISLAYYLQKKKEIGKISILEKDNKIGGLCRSFKFKKIIYDIGPHIIFSKYKDILNQNINLLKNNIVKIKRSNKILYKKKIRIKYPFENQLSKLPNNDLKYVLKTFVNNKHASIKPKNMHEFFLKTFGKGITDLYLAPYNKKIWKLDPSKLDMQMVERIPQPPIKDIINSAKGKKTEGYKHQLFFYYPKKGGIQKLIDAYKSQLGSNVKIHKNIIIKKINSSKKELFFKKNRKNNKANYDLLINTSPLNTFYKYFKKNQKIRDKSKLLKYNSIIIALININYNIAGNNFAFNISDKDIIFHRICKLDFLGDNYSIQNTTTFLLEITFNPSDTKIFNNSRYIKNKIIEGMLKINFLKNKKDINFFSIKTFEYAYVIYNLQHRKSVDCLIKYYNKLNIKSLGRWGSWEYLNSDQVIKQSEILSKEIL